MRSIRQSLSKWGCPGVESSGVNREPDQTPSIARDRHHHADKCGFDHASRAADTVMHSGAQTVEKGLALPRGSVPQSDQAQLACFSRHNGPAGTSQSTYIVGTAQQMPLHTSAACTNLHKLSSSWGPGTANSCMTRHVAPCCSALGPSLCLQPTPM